MVKQYVEGFLERNQKLFLGRIKEGKIFMVQVQIMAANNATHYNI